MLLDIIWILDVPEKSLPKDPEINHLSEKSSFSAPPENLEPTLSITVIGASGDLARKKIFPALFALYYDSCLPKVVCS